MLQVCTGGVCLGTKIETKSTMDKSAQVETVGGLRFVVSNNYAYEIDRRGRLYYF